MADYPEERQNTSINIFNCEAQGAYQCGWGDCSTNFTNQSPFSIIFRDGQKSAATSLPSKGSNTLAVGLGVGLSLGICLLASLWLQYRQHRRLKEAESTICRRSTEKPFDEWQWSHGSEPSSISQPYRPLPPQSAYTSPIRYEPPPTALSGIRGPQPPPKIPNGGRGLQELKDESNQSHELDSYNCDLNGTRAFV